MSNGSGTFESGGGDDPFADDEMTDESTESSPGEQEAEQKSQTRKTEPEVTNTSAATFDESTTEDPIDELTQDIDPGKLALEFVPPTYDKQYPWALGRKNATDGRNGKALFRIQEQILDLEETCQEEVGEILDGDVNKTDLREAALILAYHQPGLLARALREWGAESA